MRASRDDLASLPEPMMPPYVDLREFPFMPVDIVRLFGSQFHANANDSEWRAGFTLWLKSYHQVPCASIPDDDIALARLAELGRDVKGWKKIKVGSLRGWVKCSDGRLYHEVVAEKAAIGWNAKQQQQWKRDCDRVRKENKTRGEKGLDALPMPDRPVDLVKISNGTHVIFRPRRGGIPTETDPVSSGKRPESRTIPTDFPLENGLKGEGEGEGEGDSTASQQRGAASAKRLEPHDDGPEAFAAAQRACVNAIGDGHPIDPVFGPMMLLVQRGLALREILTVLRSEAALRRSRRLAPIRLWSKWAEIVVERLDAAPKVDPLRTADPDVPTVDFGNDCIVSEASVRTMIEQNLWPNPWGPPIGAAGCRLPKRLWPAAALAEEAAHAA